MWMDLLVILYPTETIPFRPNSNDDIFSFEMIEKAIFNNEFQNLSGKFEYFKLKDAPSNLEVMLLDDEGNVFAVTSTDDNGHFNFDYIPTGKKYT